MFSKFSNVSVYMKIHIAQNRNSILLDMLLESLRYVKFWQKYVCF